MRRAFYSAFGSLLCWAGAAAGQTQNCTIIDRPGSTLQYVNQGLPSEVIILQNPTLDCDGGRRVTAQEGVVTRASGTIRLYRQVRVVDPDRTLTADQVEFFNRQRHLAATGRALIVHNDGSRISGDIINYYQQSNTRPVERVESVGTSSLARAVMRETGPDGRASRDSTVLEAAQITITGQDSFRGVGNATMTQDSIRTSGYTIDYTSADRTLRVAGGGRVVTGDYTLTGDSIDATVNAQDQIETVLTRHGATVVSEGMRVVGGAVRLMFTDGTVSRLVAMPWRAQQNAPAAPRARVDSDEFVMESDSIDVAAPDGEIREAVAIGRAYGERVTPDSLRALLPEASDSVMRLIANDWMRGDTVRAFFAAAPPGDPDARDGPSGERVMERLQASGAPAQSIYRMRDENRPEAKLSVSYLTAGNIVVEFIDGVVSVVTASQDARGVYIQPADSVRRAGGRTAGR